MRERGKNDKDQKPERDNEKGRGRERKIEKENYIQYRVFTDKLQIVDRSQNFALRVAETTHLVFN